MQRGKTVCVALVRVCTRREGLLGMQLGLFADIYASYDCQRWDTKYTSNSAGRDGIFIAWCELTIGEG